MLMKLKRLLEDGGIEDALCWVLWGLGIYLMFALCK